MSDNFKYFLKPEERRSLQPKKKATRKWNVIFMLGNITLLMLIFFLVYKPAMEKLNDESKFYIENFSVKVEYELTQKGIFVDLYIFNEGEDRDFDFSKLICKVVFTDGTELPSNNINDKNEQVLKNTGIHYLFSYSINQDRLNQKFFIRILYDEKKVFESKTIDFGNNK